MLATVPAVAVWLALLAGCSTDPVNPDGCRAIENARCEAAEACSTEYPNLDVDACKRFYEDHCLHGLASEGDPGQPRIDQCIRAIQAAGACAKASSPSCDLELTKGASACQLIQHPEQYAECSFLAPPVTVVPDAGPEASEPGDDASAGD